MRRSCPNSAPNEVCELADGWVVEQVADIQLTGVFFLDGKHDFGECKRTHANLKEILIRADFPFLGKFSTDQLQFADDRVIIEVKGEARSKAGLDYNNDYCIVVIVTGGKIQAVREYLDTELVTSVFGKG